jgi:chromosomal replication initiation ATPase DnaA
MQRQLTFDLAVRPALGRGDFMVSPSNAAALAAIDSEWPQGKLVLTGPRASGKSHLALVWAAEHPALLVQGADLVGLDLGQIDPGAVVVEDADAVAGDPHGEQALFHLHNMVMAAGGKLLLTATAAPARWPIALPDLASRLSATATATLEPPDDLLLSALLVKLFADRQLRVPLTLIPYLVQRMDRSFAAANAMVAALDARALAERRAITRHFAARVLDSAPQTRP